MRRPWTRRALLGAGWLLVTGLLGASPADRAQTATGTVSKIQASERAVTVRAADGSETRFVWNADTKISGVLAPGARVTIRYEVASDGRNLAQQISVARN